jgi:predicted AlkP superfamily pyrophosphatase or phosphodiesterase
VDRLIAPLLFSYAGDFRRATLTGSGADPAVMFPTRTLYHTLAEAGVQSFIVQHRDYTPSPFSDVMFAGARPVAYKTAAEALVTVTDLAAGQPGPTYIFAYFDTIDWMGHHHGPGSRPFEAEVDSLMNALERLLHSELQKHAKNTLLLVTADHGQMELDPATTVYLNQVAPDLTPMIRRNRAGDLLVPGGSARDLFLYIRDEQLEEAAALLRSRLSASPRPAFWSVSATW